jgi:DNA-binding NarL/FixJ family response regulator
MAAAERCVRIAIIDPHELTVAGLTQVLTQCRSPHFRVVPPEHANPPADIVLYNVEQHSGGSHDPALHALIRQTRSTVIATFRDEPRMDVESALVCGAHGAVSMTLPADDLVKHLTETHRARRQGEGPPPASSCQSEVLRTGLTPRELEVLSLIGAGLTNQEIADRLYISLNTVKTYIRWAYQRIGTTRRSQAVIWVARHGLTTPLPAQAPDYDEAAAG